MNRSHFTEGRTSGKVGRQNLRVLKTPDGEDVVVSINSDVCLYRSPVSMNGIDIYAHRAPSGTMYYYAYAWSTLHQAAYSIITPVEVQNHLTGLARLSGVGRLNDDERETAERYFPGIFDGDQ